MLPKMIFGSGKSVLFSTKFATKKLRQTLDRFENCSLKMERAAPQSVSPISHVGQYLTKRKVEILQEEEFYAIQNRIKMHFP